MKKTNGLGSENPAMEAWHFGVMAFELFTTALTTISLRCWGYTVGWPADSQKMNAEGQRMVDEKIDANMEYFTFWMQLVSNPYAGIENPWGAGRALMAPYHQRTCANAHRLTH